MKIVEAIDIIKHGRSDKKHEIFLSFQNYVVEFSGEYLTTDDVELIFEVTETELFRGFFDETNHIKFVDITVGEFPYVIEHFR